ncbi:Protein of unknown function [Gryllus bimaculatus]|nr:Protein of unknown function [Gryllus bimaculatus]
MTANKDNVTTLEVKYYSGVKVHLRGGQIAEIMARNIEIKSHLRDKNKVLDALKELTDHPGEIIKQTDTFFGVPKGRLKLRQIEVVLKSGQTSEDGQQIAEDIMAKLGIKNDDLIAVIEQGI